MAVLILPSNSTPTHERFFVEKLSHLDEKGEARMVDVTAKPITFRQAVARGKVMMRPETAALIHDGGGPKGDVFSTARIAGIMAAKKTPDLIPMCHPVEMTGIDISFSSNISAGEIVIEARAGMVGRTGIEMEVMTAVSVAALTIYDMCKAVDRGIVLSDIKLIRKEGGKSGVFVRPDA